MKLDFSLWEEHRLRVFGNTGLRRVREERRGNIGVKSNT
jgi:hypothetical protein